MIIILVLVLVLNVSDFMTGTLAEDTEAGTICRVCVQWKSENICLENTFHVSCSSWDTPRGPQTPAGPAAVVPGCCRPVSRGPPIVKEVTAVLQLLSCCLRVS